jgi:hypothetical protein
MQMRETTIYYRRLLVLRIIYFDNFDFFFQKAIPMS